MRFLTFDEKYRMTVRNILAEFQEAQAVLEAFSTAENMEKIEKGIAMMHRALANGHKIMSCGNGGSMCDAMHFAEELSGRYRNNRPALAAVSISDPSHLSCVANDYGYDHVFSRYVEGLGQTGDVLLGISTSGNSKNVMAEQIQDKIAIANKHVKELEEKLKTLRSIKSKSESEA